MMWIAVALYLLGAVNEWTEAIQTESHEVAAVGAVLWPMIVIVYIVAGLPLWIRDRL